MSYSLGCGIMASVNNCIQSIFTDVEAVEDGFCWPTKTKIISYIKALKSVSRDMKMLIYQHLSCEE